MDVNERHKQEAIDFNFVLVGKSTNNNPNYRQYKCLNGHLNDFQVQHMRRKSIRCPECYEEYVSELASSIGYKLLGKSELGWQFRKIEKDCGCVEDIRVGNLRVTKDKRDSGLVTCKTCYRRNLQQAAEKAGITLLEDIDTYNIKVQFNSCGHYKEVNKAQIFRNNLVCRECIENYHIEQVESIGLKYLGTVNNSEISRYRMYKLPCGHEKVLRMDHASDGSYLCDICGDSHYTKPSSIYLFKFETDNFSWLKLGYSLNAKIRKSSYGVIDNCKSTLICLVNFDTGAAASKVERALHRKFKNERLCKKLMNNYLINNGYTECYPAAMETVLSEELRRIDGG